MRRLIFRKEGAIVRPALSLVRKSIFTAVTAFLLLGSGSALFAEILDRWEWRNPVPLGADLRHVAFGNGTFVAAGASGALVTSTNGIDWKAVSSGASNTSVSVAFGNGVFVAVTRDSVLTSSNGTLWSLHAAPYGSQGEIAFGNGHFLVTVPGLNTNFVVTSSDGIAWTPHALVGDTNSPHAMTYADGEFLGVQGAASVEASPDGIAWAVYPRLTSLQLGSYLAYVFAITRGNGTYAAVGENDKEDEPGFAAWSTNLVDWVAQRFASGSINAVAFANGRFVAVGTRGIILTALTDSAWVSVTSPVTDDLYAVASGNGALVAVGANGTIASSVDGQPWIRRSSLFSSVNLRSVLYADGVFIAAGDNGLLKVSSHGADWTNATSHITKDLRSIAFGRGTFVIVGQSGNAVTSSDRGATWTNQPPGAKPGLFAVTFGHDLFLAVGDNNVNGVSLASSDGTNWSAAVIAAASKLQGITWAAGKFVAVGANGVISTSVDGASWTARNSGVATSLNGISFGNGRFVAVGSAGTIVTSPDGAEWTLQTNTSVALDWERVTFADGLFIVVGPAGTLASSADAIHWSSHWTGNPNNLRDIAFGNGRFVTVGNASSIMRSESLAYLVLRVLPAGDDVDLAFSGERGRSYRIQSSPDFISWSDSFSFIAVQSETNLVDGEFSSRRFYRVVSP